MYVQCRYELLSGLTLLLGGTDGTLLLTSPGLALGTATVGLGHVDGTWRYTPTTSKPVETIPHPHI